MKRESLTIEQIWGEYHKGRENGNGIFYRNLLIEHYRDLVKYCAERLRSELPDNVELDDLISMGIFGLMDAIHKYDPAKNVKFETYCASRLKGSIIDELRRADWVPRVARNRFKNLEKAKCSLKLELGREPSLEELTEELAKEKYKDAGQFKENKKIKKILESTKNFKEMISLPNTEYKEDEENKYKIPIITQINDKESLDPLLELQKKELKDLLTRGLTRAERLIIVLYYYGEMTMGEIGKVLELSESRVSQLHKSIIARLKAKLCDRKKDYLEEIFS